MCEDDSELAEFMEVSETEFKQKVKDWQEAYEQKKSKDTEKKLKDNDWICSNCQQLNQMDADNIKSCYCKKCKEKNDVIEYMLEALTNQNIQK